MPGELDVLSLIDERLAALDIPYMLTGSFAMAFYETPRMTRDLDLVVDLVPEAVGRLVSDFAGDFYVDDEGARHAVATAGLFNLMHLASGIKVDFIVRKPSEYRLLEFTRRRRLKAGASAFWVASREDLILSKLVWARDSGSELQRRDVRALLAGPVDREYLQRWAAALDVTSLLSEVQ